MLELARDCDETVLLWALDDEVGTLVDDDRGTLIDVDEVGTLVDDDGGGVLVSDDGGNEDTDCNMLETLVDDGA